jgi:L-aminopeptidase/D-esterase-like protein
VAATAGEGPLEGRVGAGTGATVGKLAGMEHAVPGGIGSAGARLEDGSMVAALVVNNAIGNVVGRDGSLLAGVPLPAPAAAGAPTGTSTVLVVVATDATLDRSQARKLAELAHDGIARAISPPHTLLDGDVAFMLSTARRPAPASLPELVSLGATVVEVVQGALERSVAPT